MGLIYDPFLGRIRYTWSPGAGIDMSGGTISAITPPDGVPYVAGPGIGIFGSTIYATGGVYNAGAGLRLDGSTFSLATAEVQDVLSGTQTVEAVDVSALRGALTAGQAVDVTSQPDNVTGDYKGTFSVTGSLGFASFPKFASDLSYLMIADLTATTSGTVTPSGTWLDGTTTAKSLAAGTSTRVAMLFDAADKAKFTFASTGSVSVSNCREYEVTACSNEAIAYIAALSNPDAFASYYLVKADMVQPWTYIIDMGSSPAVTIASGLSYKLNATTGTHQLTVDTCPAGYDGRDAIIRIRLGGNGVIQAIPPLQLGGALVPYAVNNCAVRFRDGEAVLLVEDTLAGYVVTVNTGTGEGSLPYGLAATGVPYIAFSPSTNGIPVELSGATTAAEEVTVVGNGRAETVLSGSFTGTSQTTLTNLTFSGAIVANGATLLADGIYHIDTVTGLAGLTIGSGAIVDLTGNTNATPINPVGGVTFAPGGATVYPSAGQASAATVGGVTVATISNTAVLTIFSTNPPTDAYFENCTLTSTSSSIYYVLSGTKRMTLKNVTLDTKIYMDSAYGAGGIVDIAGTFVATSNGLISAVTTNSSVVNIAAGAVLTLGIYIAAASIVVEGDITVGGVTVRAGTYTKINTNGTTVPPQA